MLERAAHQENHRFVERMRLEWESGKNRFDRPGEILLGVHDVSGSLIAFGGVNIDPYLNDAAVARLRHLYVAPDNRRFGLGRALVVALTNHAKRRFTRLRLRTFNPQADIFYREIGFVLTSEPEASHSLDLC